MSQDFRLLYVSNLSVLNFRFVSYSCIRGFWVATAPGNRAARRPATPSRCLSERLLTPRSPNIKHPASLWPVERGITSRRAPFVAGRAIAPTSWLCLFARPLRSSAAAFTAQSEWRQSLEPAQRNTAPLQRHCLPGHRRRRGLWGYLVTVRSGHCGWPLTVTVPPLFGVQPASGRDWGGKRGRGAGVTG